MSFTNNSRDSSRTASLIKALIVTTVVAGLCTVPPAAAQRMLTGVAFDLNATTQAPFWPPAEVMDEDGNFPVVGALLNGDDAGNVSVGFGAALVSYETVPPLDADGREDFSNVFGAPYRIIRPLDLSPGSPDLDMVLYTNSFGPPEGDFGGGPRVPADFDSLYNLNSLPTTCADVFPSSSQRFSYRRESVPMHLNYINGFQGDQVGLDADTGDLIDPMTASGPGCGAGCSGENIVDFNPFPEPVTLGSWLSAEGRVEVRLTNMDREAGGFTMARMKFEFRNLIPNGIYTIWMVRQNVGANQGLPEYRQPDPGEGNNVVIANSFGRAKKVLHVPNPFPDPATDEAGLRMIGIAVDFHSDHQNWGACFSRLAAGVDIHANLAIFDPSLFEGLLTVPPVKAMRTAADNWFPGSLFGDGSPGEQLFDE